MTGREAFKHDLAHTLGMTVQQLSQQMTERELRRWMAYARDRMLPGRRVEHGLAMISLVIARVMGGNTELSLSDFIIGEEKRAKDDSVNDFMAATGVKAFRLGQRRKKKG